MDSRILTILKEESGLYRSDKNVIGLLVFGSVARGSTDTFSDIDLYVLVRRARSYHRRNYLIRGVRVDAFFETPQEARQWLKREAQSVLRPFAHMLAHGGVVFFSVVSPPRSTPNGSFCFTNTDKTESS